MATPANPRLSLNGGVEPTSPVGPTDGGDVFKTPPETPRSEKQVAFQAEETPVRPGPNRTGTYGSTMSQASIPPPGSVLTGKQEHYLKRELLSQQSKHEIQELSTTTALQRFGAPFRSDAGEVAPKDSDFPILRFIFNHHVRNFPFLDKAREKEFWQDKLQTFLESFASKHISASEDRLEETKRKKLATKAEKLVELMMVSGIPTASGYEERIRFSELEIIDRGAQDQGLVANRPEGQYINGWDVNVAAVRTASVKRHVRKHQHAEFILRVKQEDQPEIFIARRFSEFVAAHKQMRLELPGKVLPPLPRRNKTNTSYFGGSGDADDASSIDSASTHNTGITSETVEDAPSSNGGLRAYLPFGGGSGHKRGQSASSLRAISRSPRASSEALRPEPKLLYREEQRVSLRAFLRTFLQNQNIAKSNVMKDFLTARPITLSPDELDDVARRKEMDEKRMEEQRQFYEVAKKRAAELDVHMEKFRRDIVERNGLSKLFQEIRVKKSISELSPEYQKFAEWLRIEVAATLYHLFLAEDNAPELFAQAKRIHSLVPYTVLKNVIRIANPAAVMAGVLDLFLAQPWGAKSLLQRVFGMAMNDGIRQSQKTIDTLSSTKINDDVLCERITAFTNATEETKNQVRAEAIADQVDLVVSIMKSEYLEPALEDDKVGKVFNAFVAWNTAVESVGRQTPASSTTHVDDTNTSARVEPELRPGAELFAHLKQLLKLRMRQRDKQMMLELIEQPNTLQLFRDLFTIFYEPLVRVYKSANVYNSITDFASFVDDTIKTIEAAQRADISSDPNQTVQAFIDLCERHQDDFYKFVHEVHNNDNGLFDALMGWVEGILEFLRKGPTSGAKLDMNALFQGAIDGGVIDKRTGTRELNQLIRWQMARKRWHQDKTRQKMASGGTDDQAGYMPGSMGGLKSSDFGLNEMDLQDLELDDDGENYDDEEDDSEIDEEEMADPIAAERKRRARQKDALKRTAGEPKKPEIRELNKLHATFLSMLRSVLAE